MRKVIIATIMMGISIGLAGCSNSTISDNKNMSTNKITVEEAKEIALKHANLTADQVSFFRVETDIDNGVEKYDIEFYYGNKEYDYEINAVNGQIIGYDYDVENYNIPGTQSTNNSGTTQNQAAKITIEEAKEIALKHMNLTSDQVRFGKCEIDFDDGIQKYDIEFYNNNKEYNYEIDANTGSILSYEQD